MKHQLLFVFTQFIVDEFTDHKTLVALIIIGMIAGVIAQLVMPGRGQGMVATAIIGWSGCFLSNMFVYGHLKFIQNHILKELAGAIIVSMVITLGVNLARGPEYHPKAKSRNKTP